jgi:uncharacterized circularly permuted ATP-grasp superfamily protein
VAVAVVDRCVAGLSTMEGRPALVKKSFQFCDEHGVMRIQPSAARCDTRSGVSTRARSRPHRLIAQSRPGLSTRLPVSGTLCVPRLIQLRVLPLE